MLQPYLIPLLVVALGVIWLIYIRAQPPRMDIVCESSHHPFRQEWDDSGGHQILFRIGIKNLSKRKGINRAEVLLTSIEPFDIHCIPSRLRLMNEAPSVHDFFLPPERIQYVDVIQQTLPSGDLLLWHTVETQPKTLSSRNYTITATALGNNAQSISKQFDLIQQGTAFAFKPRIDNS